MFHVGLHVRRLIPRSLQECSDDLVNDRDRVQAAIQLELVHDRDFMLHVVLDKPGGGPMWKLAPYELQQDPALCY
jgi:hypothetical protein